MHERLRRSVKHRMLTTLSMALVVLLVSACGIGEDDDDGTETSEAVETATIAVETPTLSTGSAPVLTPSPDAAGTEATPGPQGATPTPAIVVSAPPVTVPTMAPTTAASPVAPPAAPAEAGVASGDGTGGALGGATASSAGPGPAGTPVAAPAGATPAAEAVVATSCDLPDYPPYTGSQPNQATTIDVNFRAGPGTDCDPIGEPIAAGVVVEVVGDPVQREGEEFTWVPVVVDGAEGWLATEFLEPAAE